MLLYRINFFIWTAADVLSAAKSHAEGIGSRFLGLRKNFPDLD